jgi:peptide-methionine (S)-S-oxide reductase
VIKNLSLVAFVLLSFTGISQKQKAYFASGCFWCVEAIFETIPGVVNVTSGYCGGTSKNPTYQEVCSGKTGHAETVEVTFNRNKVSYKKLLAVFFDSHDPATLNQQGPDRGTQYRSAIFYLDEYQRLMAEEYIESLVVEKKFKRITTTIEKMNVFFPAELYHQDFVKKNPDNPYVISVSNPRKRRFFKKVKKN